MVEDRDYMRQPEFGQGMGIKFSMTMLLIVLNLAAFIILEICKGYNIGAFVKLFHWCALSNDGVAHGFVWQYLTFQFLHAGAGHFIGNMIGLFFFGRAVEDRIGGRRLVLLYLACGVFGGVLQTVLGLIIPGVFGLPVVGASAGVLGLLAVVAAYEPDSEILIFFVLPVKIKYLAGFTAVVAAFYTLIPAAPGMAHAAHLGGMAMGWAFVRVNWRRFLPSPKEKMRPTERRPKLQVLESSSAKSLEGDVDAVLDKISAHGLKSLTSREREILEAARKKL